LREVVEVPKADQGGERVCVTRLRNAERESKKSPCGKKKKSSPWGSCPKMFTRDVLKKENRIRMGRRKEVLKKNKKTNQEEEQRVGPEDKEQCVISRRRKLGTKLPSDSWGGRLRQRKKGSATASDGMCTRVPAWLVTHPTKYRIAYYRRTVETDGKCSVLGLPTKTRL
jgi:hypothetical protein